MRKKFSLQTCIVYFIVLALLLGLLSSETFAQSGERRSESSGTEISRMFGSDGRSWLYALVGEPFALSCYIDEAERVDQPEAKPTWISPQLSTISFERLTVQDRIAPSSGGNQTLLALAVCAIPVTLALLETDQQTYSSLHSWKKRNPVVNTLSPIVTQLGDGTTSLTMFGGLFFYGTFAKEQSAKQAGIVGLESFALSGATTQLLKHVFSRERPSTATKAGGAFQAPFSYFRQRHEKRRGFSHFDAFPSGHSATVFAAATTLADAYQKPWVAYTAYGTATAVAISRITESTHWASDVFAGAVIGIFSTKAVEWFNQSSTITIIPLSDSEDAGLTLSVRF